ncbi:MAG: cytochrome P450 [Gammaproteobacteria bacterium]|nr:cytochrome P450 [Gammaproteobacteria bacterium]
MSRTDQMDRPIDAVDVSDPSIYETDSWRPIFARLRSEAPVHHCSDSPFGPYWSITRFEDIMAVDSNHQSFSSIGGVSIGDRKPDFEAPNFISMDPPKHDAQRMSVTPAVAPMQLQKMEPLIRERVCQLLDDLPERTPFNWVDRVSVELTTQMLATLFDFPFEERRKLTAWSDLATSSEAVGGALPDEERRAGMFEMLDEFKQLWAERRLRNPEEHPDFITLMANDPRMQAMDDMEFMGNLILLIIGGNDTTRNSISGGVLGLSKTGGSFDQLLSDPSLVPGFVPEVIRWQTPLAHMRRIATEDVELQGQSIKAGDKVVMWYISGNRDESVINDPETLTVGRSQPRRHLSFGFGIHRCLGNRLAEMQLKVLWEEILKRFKAIDVVKPEVRVRSNFIHGISELEVEVSRHS